MGGQIALASVPPLASTLGYSHSLTFAGCATNSRHPFASRQHMLSRRLRGRPVLSTRCQGESNEGRQLSDLVEFGCDETGCTLDLDDERQADSQKENGPELVEDPSSEFVSDDPAEVRRFLTERAKYGYEVKEVTSGGQIRDLKVERGKLLQATGLRTRDLRAVVVQPLPGSESGPVLRSRKGTLLLGLGMVRAIVESDRALLFGGASKEQTRFLRVFENQRRSATGGSFKMLFVESALLALTRQLGYRLLKIRTAASPKLQTPLVLLEPDLEEVRQQRRVLVRCLSQASAVSVALHTRLDGDEVSMFAVGENSTVQDDSAEEWEAMLEVYLQAYSEISRECASLLSDIEDFEGSANLALQVRRLRLEQFELILVITSVSLGLGNLVPGWMGMNLFNRLETSDGAFGMAVVATLTIAISLFVGLRFLAAQRGFLE